MCVSSEVEHKSVKDVCLQRVDGCTCPVVPVPARVGGMISFISIYSLARPVNNQENDGSSIWC